MKMAGNAAGRKALGAATAAGVRHMAHRFIVGESPRAALDTISALWRDGIAASVDLLGEATVTTAEADRYAERCDEALVELSEAAAGGREREWLERDTAGPIPRVNLSVKVTALTPLMRPEAPELGRDDAATPDATAAAPRARPGRPPARRHGVASTRSRPRRSSSSSLLAEDEFAYGPSAGIVLQAYLRDSPAQLDTLLDWARVARARARRSSSAW